MNKIKLPKPFEALLPAVMELLDDIEIKTADGQKMPLSEKTMLLGQLLTYAGQYTADILDREEDK